MKTHQSDFLIIGSGVAGLLFALHTAQVGRVALVTKKAAMESNTNQAQGGIAAVFDGNDSFDLHIQDTLASGAGLCHPEVVKLVVKEGPRRIEELVGRGVSFSRHGNAPSEAFDLGREGGHSRNRIVHTQDMTGREVERALLEQVRAHPNIELFENHIAIDLITHSIRMKRGQVTTTHEEHCCGAYVLDRQSRRVKTFGAGITLPVATTSSPTRGRSMRSATCCATSSAEQWGPAKIAMTGMTSPGYTLGSASRTRASYTALLMVRTRSSTARVETPWT